MTQPSLHLDAPESAPVFWDGLLSHLFGVLTHEAEARPGRWAHRQLRHGALVAVQIGPERRRILRIARPERPANEKARERWATELATFHKHLGTGKWQQMPDEEEVKGIAVRYLELYEGETEPGKALCDGCKKPIPFDRVWGKKQRCDNCARLAGEDESREILGRRSGSDA